MKINKLLYAGAALTLLGACAPTVKAPEAILPVPEEKQVDWQKMETYAFVHFGLNTFNDRDWDTAIRNRKRSIQPNWTVNNG